MPSPRNRGTTRKRRGRIQNKQINNHKPEEMQKKKHRKNGYLICIKSESKMFFIQIKIISILSNNIQMQKVSY